MIPRSGRPRRGPAVRRPGPQQSDRLTSGRQQRDRHRGGYLANGRQWDGRRRTNHGWQAGRFVGCRHPGMSRRRQGAAAGRHLRPDRRNGARAPPRAGHHRGDHQCAGHQCAGDRRGSHQSAGCHYGGHLHGGHRRGGRRCADDRHGSHPCAGCCPAEHPHADHRPAGHPYGAGRHGSYRCASCHSAGHRREGRRCGAGPHGSHPCAGCCPAEHPHADRQHADRPCGAGPHEDHRYADQRVGNYSPADCHPGRGHERDGRCSRRRSRATRPGRPGRCRCGRNPAYSPVSHPTGCSGPDGCHSSCFHPDCWAAGQCFQCPGCQCPGCQRHRFRRPRTGPRPYRWRVPDRYSRRDPGQHHCWDGPDRRRYPPSGSGCAPCHRYGPGRPDPARLPRSCSTLS